MFSFLKSFINEEKCKKKHYSHKEEEEMVLKMLSKFNDFDDKHVLFISYDYERYEDKQETKKINLTVNKITIVPFYVNKYDLDKNGEIVNSEKRQQIIKDNNLEDQWCDHGQFNNPGELYEHEERDNCTLTQKYKIYNIKIIKIYNKYVYPITYEFLIQNISKDTASKIVLNETHFINDNINYIPDFRKLPFIISSHPHKFQ